MRNLAFHRMGCAALLLVTFAIYGQVAEHEFVGFDDGSYVYANPQVQAGITLEAVEWAFTTTHFGIYHPLTWLSHMLDCEVYGLEAGGHHLTNLVFHLATRCSCSWLSSA